MSLLQQLKFEYEYARDALDGDSTDFDWRDYEQCKKAYYDELHNNNFVKYNGTNNSNKQSK
jgi:hypothetical protein